ncbi:MAG: hypothetical protein A3J70_00875 [Elusimicrobia bacterium RIFCSPHIGHO2_02_FULL_61_10]|nr:MAG: hypothetical protein A3J70_00875 [Elusimicrobia bacterium RIFCSPHIGHO2_02_FULL_61_10]
MFVNPANRDFRLQSGSPARTLGVDVLDLDNDGSTTDVIPAGAYVTGNEIIGRTGGGGTPPDVTPPSVPGNLSAVAVSSTQINLSWSASTDNVGVAGYRIFRGGSQIATVSGTSYSNTGLTASTQYSYTVAAYDAAGNVSAQSAAATAETPGSSGGTTNLRMTFPPEDASRVIVAVKTNDPLILGEVNGGAVEVSIEFPGGAEELTLEQMAGDASVLYAYVSTSSLTVEDVSMRHGAEVGILVGGRRVRSGVETNVVSAAFGGRVWQGRTQVVVMPGQMSGEGRMGINALGSDAGRRNALNEQNLMLLGEEMDFTLSSGSLNRATVLLAYDGGLIPQGLGLSQARIAYFNPSTGRWEVQENVAVQGDLLTCDVSHFSIYAPVLVLPAGTPSVQELYVYPNPSLGADNPTIRVKMGSVDTVEIDIYDVSGTRVHTVSFPGTSPQIDGDGQYYYEYAWLGDKASGVYVASVKGKTSTATVKGKVKFAVIR